MSPVPLLVRRTAAAGLRCIRSLYFFEWWILGMVAAMHLLFLAKGWGLMLWTYGISISVIAPQALVAVPLGMAAVAAWEGVRSRSWSGVVGCFRAWRRPAWWGLTLRIWVAIQLSGHVYIWLKLQVPFLNGHLLDLWVWRMEEGLFFGYSPNRFFLELFSQPWILHAVDWSYARVFLMGLYAAISLFPVLPSNRLRAACTASYVMLWTLGGWLHVLLPALGPCYWFPSVWEPYAEWLRNNMSSQAGLLKNYRDLTMFRFSEGFRVNPLWGVAAIPSLHNASQALLAFWAMRLNRSLGLLVWGSVALIFIGSVVTGWHYLIDAVTGVLLAWGVFLFARRLGRTPPKVPGENGRG